MQNCKILILIFIILKTGTLYCQIGEGLNSPASSFKRIVNEIYPNLTNKEKKIVDQIHIDLERNSDSQTAYAFEKNNKKYIYISDIFLRNCVYLISSIGLDSIISKNFSNFYSKEYYYAVDTLKSPAELLEMDEKESNKLFYSALESEMSLIQLFQTTNFVILHEVGHHVLGHPKKKKSLLKKKDPEIDSKLKSFEYEADLWAIEKLRKSVFFEVALMPTVIELWSPRLILRNPIQYPTVPERMINILENEKKITCIGVDKNINKCNYVNSELNTWIRIKKSLSVFNEDVDSYMRAKLINKILKYNEFKNSVDIYHFLGVSILKDYNIENRIDSALTYLTYAAEISEPKSTANELSPNQINENPYEIKEKCALLSAILYEENLRRKDLAKKYFSIANDIAIFFPKAFYERKLKKL